MATEAPVLNVNINGPDVVDHGDRKQRAPRRRGGIVRIAAFALAATVAAGAADKLGIVDFGHLFKGGKSDPAPHGQVMYKGQTARTASERFVIEIGRGESTVDVKAKQNWDKRGTFWNGDIQSTNGTSSVANPTDRDLPANLKVQMRYCADGLQEATYEEDQHSGKRRLASISFSMGNLTVCDATLRHTPENDAAFKQDDTPDNFHGGFVSFVAGAVETAAKAAPCPQEELGKYTQGDYLEFARRTLAEQYGLPETSVHVAPGVIGTSDTTTQDLLRGQLKNYATMHDPKHPSREYKALDVQYLSTDASAVTESCFTDIGGMQLDKLSGLALPQPATATTATTR